MLKIGICDDNPAELSLTQTLVAQYLAAHHLQAHLLIYKNGQALLADSQMALDILFLDIRLEDGQNGLAIAQAYQENYCQTIIVLTSAYKNYISESYGFDNIFQYLLKPLEKDFFEREMARILRYYYFQNDFYYLKDNEGILAPIKFKDIVYIQSRKNQCLLQSTRAGSAPILFRACFYKQALALKKYGFLRCHKQYIVNLRFVTALAKDALILQAGHQTYPIPVSKKHYPEVNESILDFQARASLCDFQA